MNRLFDMDNKFFVVMSKIADLMILNFFCILCCLPIVTAGASVTAMYYVTMKMVRNEESYIVRGFFHSFKQNLKQSVIVTLIMLTALALLISDFTIVNQMNGIIHTILFCFFVLFAILYVFISLYIYPVLAKFYNTVRHTFTNAFLMSIRHLPTTILMLLINLLPLAIAFVPNMQIHAFLLMMFFLMGFASVAYWNSHFLVKIFDVYITPAEEEEYDDTIVERNLDALPDPDDTSV